MSADKYLNELMARPCLCEECPDCVNGKVWRDDDDYDRCTFCDGSGTSWHCDRCADIEDHYQYLEDQETMKNNSQFGVGA